MCDVRDFLKISMKEFLVSLRFENVKSVTLDVFIRMTY